VREKVKAAVGLALGDLEPLPAQLPDGAIVVLTGIAGEYMLLEDPDTKQLISWLASGVTKSALLLCVCSGSVLAAVALEGASGTGTDCMSAGRPLSGAGFATCAPACAPDAIRLANTSGTMVEMLGTGRRGMMGAVIALLLLAHPRRIRL